jgi:predicted nuclease with TOPRIM domain
MDGIGVQIELSNSLVDSIMDSGVFSEDVLWKLGISTLFILSHRLLLKRSNGSSDGSSEVDSVEANDETQKHHEEDEAYQFVNSPTDTLQSILSHTSSQLMALRSSAEASSSHQSSSSSFSSSSFPSSTALFKEIIEHSFHDNEYIENAFQQTIKIFYAENKKLKERIASLEEEAARNEKVEKSHSLLPSLVSSETNKKVEELLRENQKLQEDKRLLIQSIETAQKQFQQMQKPLANHLDSEGNGVDDSRDSNSSYDEHTFFRMKQIISEIHISESQSDNNPDDDTNTLILKKLSANKQILNFEYPSLQRQLRKLQEENEAFDTTVQELKTALNTYKLSKIQETTDLRSKLVELQQYYETKLKERERQQHSSSRSNSRSTTPNSIRKTAASSYHHLPTTPNTEFVAISGSHPFSSSSRDDDNSLSSIAKEMRKSFREVTPSKGNYHSVTAGHTQLSGDFLSTPTDKGTSTNNRLSTPSKLRKLSSSPSLNSYKK